MPMPSVSCRRHLGHDYPAVLDCIGSIGGTAAFGVFCFGVQVGGLLYMGNGAGATHADPG